MNCTPPIHTPSFPDGTSGTAGGDLSGTYPNPSLSVTAIHGKAEKTVPAGSDEIIIWDSSTGLLRRMTRTNFLTGLSSYTNEEAQDAVGTILSDTPTVALVYDDATPAITASVRDGAITSGKLASDSVTTTAITDDAVTFSKVQNIASSRLLGRSTTGAGNVEELTIGTGLSLASGILSATGAYTDEQAQDAIGSILSDTATIDLTYDDTTPAVTAQVKDGAITSGKIANGAVLDEHLDASVITGQTAETSPANDDTILVHDASVLALRKMTRGNFLAGSGAVLAPTITSVSVAGSTTRYSGPFRTPSSDLNENLVPFTVPRSGTARNLVVRTSTAQPSSGPMILTVRKNFTDTLIKITIDADSPAGAYADAVNTAEFSLGDQLTISIVNNAGTTGATIISLSLVFDV